MYKEGVGPNAAQHPHEAEGDAMASVHDELEIDEDARQQAHDKHSSRPCSPCDGAEESYEGEDRYEEREEGKARGKSEEEV